MMSVQIQADAEDLAYWYLRLNGCFTFRNFIVHPETGSDVRTDVDVPAVRFPYRCERLIEPMEDDTILTQVSQKPFVIVAEAKAPPCRLNESWRKRDNLERIVRAVGAFSNGEIKDAVDGLQKEGSYESCSCRMTIACFGCATKPQLQEEFPGILQVTWQHVLEFIHDRFSEYPDQKRAHGQWPAIGRKLYNHYLAHAKDKASFVQSIRAVSHPGRTTSAPR